jgi:tetratricopeptide (TPR) repeat protein
MSVSVELERARELAIADDHAGAQALLLSLIPQIEQLDRDDLILEVFAQLGEIYLIRSAYDGVVECVSRIRDCVEIYRQILAGSLPEAAAMVTMPTDEIVVMVARFAARADFLDVGLAAARGEHTEAAHQLDRLADGSTSTAQSLLDAERRYLITYAHVLCAVALGDNDEHVAAEPVWDRALQHLADDREMLSARNIELSIVRLQVTAGTGYGRFCVQTGRLDEAHNHLRRAGARAAQNGWELAAARADLELASTAWARSDHPETERLIQLAYPVIATHAIADDVSRCWLYLGLTRMAAGELEAADQCWEHAQRHWTELGRALAVHRIVLQRSWIEIFRGRFESARAMVESARELLDGNTHANWLHHARLDDLLGTIWRAEALADMGFDGIGDPTADWRAVEATVAVSQGITTAPDGSVGHQRAQEKFERAAALKIPAALAVDSVRHTITDADARLRWATSVSAPLMAGAFAVAWEWDNTSLVSELIEYHTARGAFVADSDVVGSGEWAVTATGATPITVLADHRFDRAAPDHAAPDHAAPDHAAVAASATTSVSTPGLTRLGPLPPLQMHPGADAILTEYRRLAGERYARDITSDEPLWPTWT